MKIKSNGIRLDKKGFIKLDKRCNEHIWNIQPERSKREDINYPKFECKKCFFTAIQYRTCIENKITCPECYEINDAVL